MSSGDERSHLSAGNGSARAPSWVARLAPSPDLSRRLAAIRPLLGRHRAAAALLVLLGTVASFTEGATVTLVAAAIGSFLGGVPPAALPGLIRSGPALAFAVIGLLLARTAATAVYRLRSDVLSAAVANDVRVAVFARFVGAPFAAALRRGTASMLNTLEWEALAIPETVGNVTAIAMDAIAIVSYATLLLLLSWRTMLLACVLGCLVLPLSAVTTPRLRRLSDQLRLAAAALTETTVATLEGFRSVRLFGAENENTGRQRVASGSLAAAERAIARQTASVGAIRQVVMLALGATFLGTLVRLPVQHGAALAAVALLYRILPHLRSLEGSITHALSNSGRLFATLDALALPNETMDDTAQADRTPLGFRRISFERVRFRYGADREFALQDVEFALERGSHTAVTGPSGSGKTTLVNLLARLVTPNEGVIAVDGQSLGTLPLQRWLATVSFAGQDLELLGGTIADNLRLGRPETDEATLWDALELAQAASFVRALPAGLATEVGERGTRLSGGQRQRLVLARALARAPLLLVLDEATNAVDPSMERAIFAALRAARPDLTVLSITHRGDLSGVDQVVTVDGGRVRRVERLMEDATGRWRASA